MVGAVVGGGAPIIRSQISCRGGSSLGFCEGVQRTQQLFGSGGEGGLDGCRYLDGVGPRSEDG